MESLFFNITDTSYKVSELFKNKDEYIKRVDISNGVFFLEISLFFHNIDMHIKNLDRMVAICVAKEAHIKVSDNISQKEFIPSQNSISIFASSKQDMFIKSQSGKKTDIFLLCIADFFFQLQNNLYKGSFIQIFPAGKYHLITNDISNKNLHLEKAIIKELYFGELYSLINNLFIGNKKHLTKLIDKSKKPGNESNFNGCLVWTIPFHSTVSEESIKKVFRKIYKENNLSFNLHIFTSGIGKDEMYFVIKANILNKVCNFFRGLVTS